MFESKQSGSQEPRVERPMSQPPSDMFSEVDPLKREGRPSPFVLKGDSQSPSRNSAPAQVPGLGALPVEHEHAQGVGRRGVLMFVLVVIVVGVAVGAGVFFLTRKSSSKQPININELLSTPEGMGEMENVNTLPLTVSNENVGGQDPSFGSESGAGTTNQEPSPKAEEPGLANQNSNSNVSQGVIDRDKDGLSLTEEGGLGTSDSLFDTDLDGLGDWEEVKVYQSDPRNPDTDGDGYIDGSEVKKGYSPIINGQ